MLTPADITPTPDMVAVVMSAKPGHANYAGPDVSDLTYTALLLAGWVDEAEVRGLGEPNSRVYYLMPAGERVRRDAGANLASLRAAGDG